MNRKHVDCETRYYNKNNDSNNDDNNNKTIYELSS